MRLQREALSLAQTLLSGRFPNLHTPQRKSPEGLSFMIACEWFCSQQVRAPLVWRDFFTMAMNFVTFNQDYSCLAVGQLLATQISIPLRF
jgi:hypothetical protein